MGVLMRSLLIAAGLTALFPVAALADDPLGTGASTAPPGQQAQSQAQLIERIRPEDFAAILQKNGYRAQVQTNKDQTYIETGMSGFTVDIVFYNCQSDGCSAIQFLMWGKSGIDAKFANNWNYNWRYTKMALGDDGSFYFTMDVSLAGGVTLSNLLVDLDLYNNSLGKLKQ